MGHIIKLTRSFTRGELECPCCGMCVMQENFLTMLQELRDRIGMPVYINSGYRCQSHNKVINGSMGSYHLIGRAVDISLLKASGLLWYRFIHTAMHVGFTGVGIAKTFLHLDNRDDAPAVWFYD